MLMSDKTKTKRSKRYYVLIPVSSDATGATFSFGEVVTDEDFPPEVIKNWLEIEPPVLTTDWSVIGKFTVEEKEVSDDGQSGQE